MNLKLALAKEFSKIMSDSLSEQEMEVVRANNREYGFHIDVCASHSFIDANMVMAEAFLKVMGRSDEMDSKEDTLLWNIAWNIAKASEFTVHEE